MKMNLKLVLACMLLAIAAIAAAGEVKWGSSYKAALAQAKKSNRLIVVDFYADW
jgi:hypothetical protein